MLDADMCFKLGGYEREDVLGLILPSMADRAFIHEYVWEQEILQPAIVRDRLNRLIDSGFISIARKSDLQGLDAIVYEGTVNLLAAAMVGQSNPRKNFGEVVTLAMAHTIGVPILLSDERNLQTIVDVKLNTGSESDIKIIRLRDVVEWIKNHPSCGIDRKTAKKIWCGSCDRKWFERYKEEFDTILWPL